MTGRGNDGTGGENDGSGGRHHRATRHGVVVDIDHFRGSASASNAAIAWLARLRAQDVTVAEQAQFALWLNASPEHQQAFDDATMLWHATAELAPVPVRSRPPLYQRAVPLAMAASVLFACLLFVLQMKAPVYETGHGEQHRVVLADGSVAFLYTASQIVVHYDDASRGIELVRGEAWFEVKPEPDRPFTVRSDHLTATALGTAFVVREFDHHTRVGVSHGLVGVDQPDLGLKIELGSGEQASISTAAVERTAFDANTELSWRQGELVYDHARLDQLLADLGRYLPRAMAVSDPKLAELKVSAVLHLTDQEAMLDALGAALPIRWKTVSDQLIIVSRKELH